MTDHILTVTFNPCPDCYAGHACMYCLEDPDTTVTVQCPGVTDSCRMWWECPEEHSDADIEAMEEEELVHGQEHKSIDCTWMTPTAHCFVAHHDELSAAADWPAPGRYTFTWDFGDGTELYIQDLEPVPA